MLTNKIQTQTLSLPWTIFGSNVSRKKGPQCQLGPAQPSLCVFQQRAFSRPTVHVW